MAPDDPKTWDPNLPRIWLDFSKLNGVVFQGNGVIDGSGSQWWAASCKRNKTNVLILSGLYFDHRSFDIVKISKITLGLSLLTALPSSSNSKVLFLLISS